MARTTSEIQASITSSFESGMAAIGITVNAASWSTTNIIRLVFYCVAYACNIHEQLFDLFKADVNTALATLKPHTPNWYRQKALGYLHGLNLLPDSDKFNTSGYTETEINNLRIVKNAAVVEQVNQYGRISLRIKLARLVGTSLEALTANQLNGFKAYMARVKDAGVRLQIDSLPADGLKLVLTIYYDPLILNGAGQRLDGKISEPVQNAVRIYLQNLPFNGLFVIELFRDALQAVEGVVIPEINSASAQYGLFPYTAISTEYNPDAGYLKLYNESTDLIITFIPHSPIK